MLLKLFALACWIDVVTASSESRLFAYRIELDEQEDDDDEARNKKTRQLLPRCHYRDKILSMERAAKKNWSEYTTDELKSEKLIK